MRPRLIEVYEIDKPSNIRNVLLVRAHDVLVVRTTREMTDTYDHSDARSVIYLKEGIGGKIFSSHDEHFPTRLSYASEADRAVDDPIAFPSAAIAAAIQGTHSLGLDRAQAEAIARSLLLPEHFDLAKWNAEMRAGHQAKAKNSPFAEFIAQSAARADKHPPAIDFAAKQRSRSAYPEKNEEPSAHKSSPT